MQTTGGAIINIASMGTTRRELGTAVTSIAHVLTLWHYVGGFLPMIDSPVYAATKAAVIHFSRSLGDLYNTHGIRVCAVCPTFTGTLSERVRE